jgi:hypothetical protein
MTHFINSTTMAANVRCRYGAAAPPAWSIKARIAAFLDGGSNGEELLHALYDHVLSEPIPRSMRTILKEHPARAR